MEEQKGKVVEMTPHKKGEENPQKMSYEQLEQVAHQLSEQARHLYNQLQETNLNNTFKRLDYLFKVAENSNSFSKEFVEKCISEIEKIMTIPEEEEEKTPNTEK